MPDTFTSLRTRLDTPTLIAALGCDKVANFSCQCLCTWTFYDLLRYRSSLNLRLTKRRELWLISPFYGWNTILESIFFFFFLNPLETWLNKRQELLSSLYFLWAWNRYFLHLHFFILWNCSFELCEKMTKKMISFMKQPRQNARINSKSKSDG